MAKLYFSRQTFFGNNKVPDYSELVAIISQIFHTKQLPILLKYFFTISADSYWTYIKDCPGCSGLWQKSLLRFF